MGRIKSLMVKRTAKKLIANQSESFDATFEHNKKVLASNMPSKPIRNKIAGYLARLVRMKQEESTRKPKETVKLESEEGLQADLY
ncbi:MAG: 30S ribosomal protein S17e [Nanoarchaeota archaeon]